MMQSQDFGAPAGFWIRFLAVIIDMIIILPVSFGLVMVGDPGIIGLIFGLFYQIYLPTSDMMGTPGKYIVGLKITDDLGNRISIGKAVVRYIGYIVSGIVLYIGFIMVGFTENKRGLHDMIASTRVTYK